MTFITITMEKTTLRSMSITTIIQTHTCTTKWSLIINIIMTLTLTMDTTINLIAHSILNKSSTTMEELFVNFHQAIAVVVGTPFLSMVLNLTQDISIQFVKSTSNQVVAALVPQFAHTVCSLSMCTI